MLLQLTVLAVFIAEGRLNAANEQSVRAAFRRVKKCKHFLLDCPLVYTALYWS
jgi:hypothetical protein